MAPRPACSRIPQARFLPRASRSGLDAAQLGRRRVHDWRTTPPLLLLRRRALAGCSPRHRRRELPRDVSRLQAPPSRKPLLHLQLAARNQAIDPISGSRPWGPRCWYGFPPRLPAPVYQPARNIAKGEASNHCHERPLVELTTCSLDGVTTGSQHIVSHTHQLAKRIRASRERIVPIGTLWISAAPVFHAFEADEQDNLSLLFRHLRQSPV